MYPYLLVYWIHSFYSLMYIVWKIWRIFPGGYKCNRVGDGLISPRRMLIITGYLSFISLISSYFWYLSLSGTSVAVNSSIYQSSPAVVFMLAIPLLGEVITLVKLISLMMSVGGACVVGIYSNRHDSSNNTNGDSIPAEWNITSFVASTSTASHDKTTPLGIMYLLLAVSTFALLQVSIKKLSSPPGDPAAIPNSLRTLGLMGVHTLLWMWPPIFILHYAGIEVFSWPSRYTLMLMAVSAGVEVVNTASVITCIALVSPMFTSVGAILVIPASVVWDYFSHHYVENYLAYIGTVAIIAGFVGFVISEVVADRRKRLNEMMDLPPSIITKRLNFGWI
ncbi:uncharacterized protein [Dysidea avara]|uniref:uncharacterized protein isoform X2 n=1 Tax=Dysidea avara TaxID=196820 RepID=UPI00332ADE08